MDVPGLKCKRCFSCTLKVRGILVDKNGHFYRFLPRFAYAQINLLFPLYIYYTLVRKKKTPPEAGQASQTDLLKRINDNSKLGETQGRKAKRT